MSERFHHAHYLVRREAKPAELNRYGHSKKAEFFRGIDDLGRIGSRGFVPGRFRDDLPLQEDKDAG